MDTQAQGTRAFHLRPGHPDFLDLPWDDPLSEWADRSERVERLPIGPSRHPVIFVNYDGRLYAFKELPQEIASKEYELLRQMESLRLPVVTPVGHVRLPRADGPVGILITRYLDYSLPYHVLFVRRSLMRYRDHLLDTLAGLLVQLHLAGAYWGDCSLSNTLFRRDAGALQAYLVDAETAEVHPQLSDGLREHDLDIMEENIYGALLDLAAMYALPPDYQVTDVGMEIRRRYRRLWHEITREELVPSGEHYRIRERVRSLNTLGFSVDEVELSAVDGGERLRLRAFVADRSFHRDLLHSLTGLEVEESQARQMVNEIQEVKATIARTENRSIPLSVAANRWLNEIYLPIVARLEALADDYTHPAELYCQLLEHKWYLSEKARRDVGHQAALLDFVRRFNG